MERRILRALAVSAALAASPCAARELADRTAAGTGAPCPGHGAGFVRLPGSPTCIRSSGRVAAGATLRVGNDRGVAAPTTVGRLAIDTRTESDLGPVRTFVRIDSGRR